VHINLSGKQLRGSLKGGKHIKAISSLPKAPKEKES